MITRLWTWLFHETPGGPRRTIHYCGPVRYEGVRAHPLDQRHGVNGVEVRAAAAVGPSAPMSPDAAFQALLRKPETATKPRRITVRKGRT